MILLGRILKRYKEDDVRELLTSLGLEEYVYLMKYDYICGVKLSKCNTVEDVIEMGIRDTEHAVLLLRRIKGTPRDVSGSLIRLSCGGQKMRI